MIDEEVPFDKAVELLDAALGLPKDSGGKVYSHSYIYKPPKMSAFALFWIRFWYRVGWLQRAQWIILQNLGKAEREPQTTSRH